MKTIRDLFIDPQQSCAEYKLNNQYVLFIEKNVSREYSNVVLVELHEYVNDIMTDFIETLFDKNNGLYTLDTPLRKLTLNKVKKIATYVI